MNPKEPILKPDENRDLGFGSVVIQESRERFLNRDGTFNVGRVGLPTLSSVNIYHLLLTISWLRFLGLVIGLYLLINVFFATLFLLAGENSLLDTSVQPMANQFWRAFFFSVETFGTIGYGTISPFSYAAHALVTIESLVGILSQALVTGLMFARFSRPTAEIKFSETAVVAPYRDIEAFMIRVVNERTNQLIDVKAQVLFARFVNENGKSVRRFDSLALERPLVSFMPLAWTIVHPITEDSPLHNCTLQDLQTAEAEFLILLTASDETFAQTVYTRSSYKPEEIQWDAKFADLYVRDPKLKHVTIDVRKLSKTQRVDK